MRYLLAIDQGTTSSRAFLVDQNLHLHGVAQQEFPQRFPQPGWVEHDPEAIWSSLCATISALFQQTGVDPRQIAGIGLTNQRETTVVWDRASGVPIHPAIVWQCRRTAPLCEALKRAGKEPLFQQRTGLLLDPYFSGTKITWLLDQVPGARTRARNGALAFGTIDSFLVWRLTGGQSHVTDVSNASRTLLMDLDTCAWSPELCDLLQVPMALLPTIVDSSAVVGTTRHVPGLPDGIPIAGMAGDQQAALFGECGFAPGDAKCTYGTGSFLMMNTGDRPVRSRERLLTTVAWRKNGRVTYALEGASFIAGAAVQWLRDGLGLVKHASEIETLARQVSSSGGVVFVPALAGLGAPHWRADARGVITGLTRGTTAAHLARATLEGIALQQCDLVTAMERDSGMSLTSLRVDGGAAANDLLLQIQADLLDRTIIRPQQIETTVIGAAALAGLAVGVWDSEEALAGHWKEDRRFQPMMETGERTEQIAAWRQAVAKA
ncbi:MAG: glycerol kinase GlpK [Deltaproteobacteria bacterium]|nr:glycerol kinase GlpK [Deltaproteobacteria bacterium]